MAEYPARIHRGTCEQAQNGQCSVLALLANLGYRSDVEASDRSIAPVLVSVTTVGARLSDLVSMPHAISVGQGMENGRDWIACGNIGGYVSNDFETDENGRILNVFIGLKEVRGSGYTGIGWLQATVDGQTSVTVFLGRELHEGSIDPMARATAASGALDSPSPADKTIVSGDPSSAPKSDKVNSLSRFFSSSFNVVVAIVGVIVMTETSMFIAWSAWTAFGPLSLIVTIQFWTLYPIWWLWRQLLGLAL